jgi:hypothetical protein
VKRDGHLYELAIRVAGYKHDVITLPHRIHALSGILSSCP